MLSFSRNRQKQMENIIKQLEELASLDQSVLNSIEGVLENSPKGRIEVTTSKGYHRFYWVKGARKQYLGKRDAELVKALMDKFYFERMLHTASQQKELIHCFLDQFDPRALIRVYEEMHPERKKLVTPLILPDEEYAAQWKAESELAKKLHRNSFEKPGEFITLNGESVRSKSEKMIADLLRHINVYYVYEYPLKLANGIVFPDFKALNLRTRMAWYWEHEGMLDNPAYAESAVLKHLRYEHSGIFEGEQLIVTRETSQTPLSTKDIEMFIIKYLL